MYLNMFVLQAVKLSYWFVIGDTGWGFLIGPELDKLPKHQRIQGDAKGMHTPCGSKARTVKSACFWLILI